MLHSIVFARIIAVTASKYLFRSSSTISTTKPIDSQTETVKKTETTKNIDIPKCNKELNIEIPDSSSDVTDIIETPESIPETIDIPDNFDISQYTNQ